MLNAVHEAGSAYADLSAMTPPHLDLATLRRTRLARVREHLKKADIPLAVLLSPVSLRYALDFDDYALFQAHIPIYYAFVPVEGPVVLCGTARSSLETVDETRPSRNISYFEGGPEVGDQSRLFAEDVAAMLKAIGADSRRVAIEPVNPEVTQGLLQLGLEPHSAAGLMEQARLIKSPEEIACIRWSIAVAELAMARMHAALHPGMTEHELWAVLHHTNMSHGGAWIDGRMLASGARTNPWLQEASHKVIEAGELVAFDTDMLGPNGYCADISRTFLCGDGRPSAEQRDLYQRAFEEVQHNMALVKPGLTFKELSDGGLRQPERFIANRYPCIAHGVGLCDEYPKIYYREDWPRNGYDGEIEQDMVLCIESYVGAVGGREGVKLEQQVLVTETGCELLSTFPFEDRLLA